MGTYDCSDDAEVNIVIDGAGGADGRLYDEDQGQSWYGSGGHGGGASLDVDVTGHSTLEYTTGSAGNDESGGSGASNGADGEDGPDFGDYGGGGGGSTRIQTGDGTFLAHAGGGGGGGGGDGTEDNWDALSGGGGGSGLGGSPGSGKEDAGSDGSGNVGTASIILSGSTSTGGGASDGNNGGVSITTTVSEPVAPTDLAVAATRETEIDLTWTDENGGTAKYEVYRDGTLIDTTVAGASSYTDTGLSDNTSYTYYVIATEDGYESGQSNDATGTTEIAPHGKVQINGSVQNLQVNSVRVNGALKEIVRARVRKNGTLEDLKDT